MSLTIPLPLIGDNIIGVGAVNESLIASHLTSVRLSTNRAFYRLDRSAGSLNIIDDTANATSSTPNAFLPFGNNVLSAASTLKVYDSIDGVWASNALTVTAFAANGTQHATPIACLKATGWCRVVFGTSAQRQAWRPTLDPNANIPSRKYIRFELDDGGDKDSFIVACITSDINQLIFRVDTVGSTTAPVRVSEVQIVRVDADDKWLDLTSVSAGSLTVIPTPTASTWVPVVGQTTLLGFDAIADAVEDYLSRGIDVADGYTVSVSGAGGSWVPVTDYVSGSNFYTAGPAALIVSPTAPSHFTSTWTPPTGWVSRTLGDLAQEGGGTITTPNKFWLRYVLSSITAPFAPRRQPVARSRCRMAGTANSSNGMVATRAHTFTGGTLHLRGSKVGTGARTVTFKNFSTGASRSIVIPVATVQGGAVQFDFEDISVAVGERYGVKIINGGATYQDANLFVEEAV